MQARRDWARIALFGLPVAFVFVFLLLPLVLTFVVSFWERAGFRFRPAFSLTSYLAIIEGARLTVLERSLLVSIEATALFSSLPIRSPTSSRSRPAVAHAGGPPPLHRAVPHQLHHPQLRLDVPSRPHRPGERRDPVRRPHRCADRLAALQRLRRLHRPGLVLHAIHGLSAGAVARRHRPQLPRGSGLLGASPWTTLRRITLPLSLPGIFAAVIFGFVGCFGESAVPIIMGGVGYQLMGNTITSSMDVLNYPLAAAISSVVVAVMLLLWPAGTSSSTCSRSSVVFSVHGYETPQPRCLARLAADRPRPGAPLFAARAAAALFRLLRCRVDDALVSGALPHAPRARLHADDRRPRRHRRRARPDPRASCGHGDARLPGRG